MHGMDIFRGNVRGSTAKRSLSKISWPGFLPYGGTFPSLYILGIGNMKGIADGSLFHSRLRLCAIWVTLYASVSRFVFQPIRVLEQTNPNME